MWIRRPVQAMRVNALQTGEEQWALDVDMAAF
jgi:hypothetical protein